MNIDLVKIHYGKDLKIFVSEPRAHPRIPTENSSLPNRGSISYSPSLALRLQVALTSGQSDSSTIQTQIELSRFNHRRSSNQLNQENTCISRTMHRSRGSPSKNNRKRALRQRKSSTPFPKEQLKPINSECLIVAKREKEAVINGECATRLAPIMNHERLMNKDN